MVIFFLFLLIRLIIFRNVLFRLFAYNYIELNANPDCSGQFNFLITAWWLPIIFDSYIVTICVGEEELNARAGWLPLASVILAFIGQL